MRDLNYPSFAEAVADDAMTEAEAERYATITQIVLDRDVDELWERYWKPLLMPNGVLDLQALKRELFDFNQLIEDAQRVYTAVTDGEIQHANANPDTVIEIARAIVSEQLVSLGVV